MKEELEAFWDSLTPAERGKIQQKLDAADDLGLDLIIEDAIDLRRLLD